MDKSLGPDVFLIFFYRHFWDIIKLEVVSLFNCLHEGTLQLERINYAHVMLIPKKKGATNVGDFRPINVLNVSVKIISKVLANRLRDVLQDLML